MTDSSSNIFGRQGHDLFLAGSSGIHFTGHTAAGHNHDPVADAQKFGHLRGDHNNGLSLVGQIQNELIDLILGANVDTAGRLVQQQHLRLSQQPAADNDLLLVAAGEAADLGLLRGSLGTHGVDILLSIGPLGLLAQENAKAFMPLQAGNNRIIPDAEYAEDTGGPALFGDQGKAIFDALAGVSVLTDLAAQRDLALLTGPDTKNALQRLGTAGAVQSGQTQHLAPTGLEGDILPPDRLRRGYWSWAGTDWSAHGRPSDG